MQTSTPGWKRSVGPAWLAALTVIGLVSASPRAAAAQYVETTTIGSGTLVYAPSVAPGGSSSYGTTLVTAPPTRGRRVHIAGIVLGAAGIAGGIALLLGGLVRSVASYYSSTGSAGGSGGVEVILGGVFIGVGAVALITSLFALAFDREPVEPRIGARVSSDGFALTLEGAF